MKIGAATYSYLYDCDVFEAVKRVNAKGFKMLEIMATPPHIWPREFGKAQREKLRLLIADLGMEVFSVNPTYTDINLLSTNPALREESLKQFQEQIDFASDIGAKLIVYVPGRVHALIPIPETQLLKLAKEQTEKCLEYATNKKITLGLEHVPFGFLKTGLELKEFYDTIPKSNYFKIVYDTANANIVEKSEDGLRDVAENLGLVHMVDNNGKQWAHQPLGEGSVNFEAVVQTLKEITYDGHIIIEHIRSDSPDADLEVSYKKLEDLGLL